MCPVSLPHTQHVSVTGRKQRQNSLDRVGTSNAAFMNCGIITQVYGDNAGAGAGTYYHSCTPEGMYMGAVTESEVP